MYKILKKEGSAKRARMTTVHGVIETPVFMNVATAGAIKGGLSADDLKSIRTQVALCNTYHLAPRSRCATPIISMSGREMISCTAGEAFTALCAGTGRS